MLTVTFYFLYYLSDSPLIHANNPYQPTSPAPAPIYSLPLTSPPRPPTSSPFSHVADSVTPHIASITITRGKNTAIQRERERKKTATKTKNTRNKR